MPAPELRPLSIGEILDVAIKIYWRNAGTFFRIVLLVVAPTQILSALIQGSAAGDRAGVVTNDPVTGEVTHVDTNKLWVYLTGTGLVVVLAAVGSLIATGACFKAVADAYLQEAPQWKTSLRFAIRHFLSILWLTVLGALAVFLGFILCVVPGIWLAICFAVAIPALLTEGVRGGGALGRSKRLVQGRWWPTFAVILVGGILAGLVGWVVAALSGVAAASGADAGSLVGFLINAVGGTLGAMISTPFTAAFVTILYFDLRVRKEGFDLQLLAERIGLAPRADGPFRPPPAALGPVGPPSTGAKPPYWPPPPGWTPSETGEDVVATEPAGSAQPPYWPPPPGWQPPGGGSAGA
jgi:hypothetical protein